MSDLNDRAAAIFGSSADGVHWPYEASGIDYRQKRTDPEKYEQRLAKVTHTRHLMVEWAERYGLRTSSVQCCPAWLNRTVSRRCMPDRCTRYGSNTPDRGWLDHGVCWIRGGKPAVITSSPYDVSSEESARITWWLERYPNLRCAQGAGWYSPSTTQIIMWRADRIETVEPAKSEAGR